jgi:hypothetical protein
VTRVADLVAGAERPVTSMIEGRSVRKGFDISARRRPGLSRLPCRGRKSRSRASNESRTSGLQRRRS